MHFTSRRRVGAIAIVQDRACDLAYLHWSLTPIYDPDPLEARVDGMDNLGLFDDPGNSRLRTGKSTLIIFFSSAVILP